MCWLVVAYMQFMHICSIIAPTDPRPPTKILKPPPNDLQLATANDFLFDSTSQVLTRTTALEDPHYFSWLPAWVDLIISPPTQVILPPSACIITTLLNHSSWKMQLSSYPNQDLVLFFLKGISTRFRIGYQTHAPNLHSCKSNL